jgi:Domain of unknown function (DUF4388)
MAGSDSSATRRHGPPRIMNGQLEAYPLTDLLQFLQSMRKRVHLLVERADPRQSGGIYFAGGRPVHAYLPPMDGDEAVMELLTWTSGRFLLIDDAVPERETVASDLQSLLLEGLRRMDESTRHLPCFPLPDTIPTPRSVLDPAAEDQLLTLREWRLLAAVDGRRSTTDLAHLLAREVSEIQRGLANLAASGLIRLHHQ